MKTRVAVLFGGRSAEHDVSIASGLQALKAFDPSRFAPLPVYVTTEGNWLTGEALADSRTYIPRGDTLRSLQTVTLDVRPSASATGRLLPSQSGLFSRPKEIEFDVAFLAFHGGDGETGAVQGLFEVANVPYTGMRVLASAVAMNKVTTKQVLEGTGVGVLPHAVLARPRTGLLLSEESIAQAMGDLRFPVIVKPVNLGSSIGAARAANVAEVRAALPAIFRLDTHAMLEPFVENLVEYNLSVRQENGRVFTSAIEEPVRKDALLDFKAKYMAGGSKVGGSKTLGGSNAGLLAMTRTLKPALPPELEAKIRSWAEICFTRTQGSGAPRIDFLSNRATGEVWLNEVNPCPGSFGFFLWEAADQPLLFPELISRFVDEAFELHQAGELPPDPTQQDARLFPRG